MKKNLTKTALSEQKTWYYDESGNMIYGIHKHISGDVSGIYGDVSDIRGNVSSIRGYVSGIRGDASDILGNLDGCGITANDRGSGIDINDLVL